MALLYQRSLIAPRGFQVDGRIVLVESSSDEPDPLIGLYLVVAPRLAEISILRCLIEEVPDVFSDFWLCDCSRGAAAALAFLFSTPVPHAAILTGLASECQLATRGDSGKSRENPGRVEVEGRPESP